MIAFSSVNRYPKFNKMIYIFFLTVSLLYRSTIGLRLNEFSENFVEVVWSPHHTHLSFLHCYFDPIDHTYEHSYTKDLPENCSGNNSKFCFSVYYELDWCFGITKCSFFVVWQTARDLYSQKQLCEILTEDSSSIPNSYEITLPRSVDSLGERNIGFSFCGTEWIKTTLTPGKPNNCSDLGWAHIISMNFTPLNLKETFVEFTVLLCSNFSTELQPSIKQNEQQLLLRMDNVDFFNKNGSKFANVSAIFDSFLLNEGVRRAVYNTFLLDSDSNPIQFSVLVQMANIEIVVDSVEILASAFNGTAYESSKTNCGRKGPEGDYEVLINEIMITSAQKFVEVQINPTLPFNTPLLQSAEFCFLVINSNNTRPYFAYLVEVQSLEIKTFPALITISDTNMTTIQMAHSDWMPSQGPLLIALTRVPQDRNCWNPHPEVDLFSDKLFDALVVGQLKRSTGHLLKRVGLPFYIDTSQMTDNISLSRCLSDSPLVQSSFIWDKTPSPGSSNNCATKKTPFYVNEITRDENKVIAEVFVPSHLQYLTNIDCVINTFNQSKSANKCHNETQNLYFLYHSSTQEFVVLEWDIESDQSTENLQIALICGAKSRKTSTFLMETRPVLIGLNGFPDERSFTCLHLIDSHKILLKSSVLQQRKSFSLCENRFQETDVSIGQQNHCQFSFSSLDGDLFAQFVITEVALIEHSPGSFVEVYASTRLQHKIGIEIVFYSNETLPHKETRKETVFTDIAASGFFVIPFELKSEIRNLQKLQLRFLTSAGLVLRSLNVCILNTFNKLIAQPECDVILNTTQTDSFATFDHLKAFQLCNEKWEVHLGYHTPWLPNDCNLATISAQVNEINVEQKSFDNNDFIEILIQSSRSLRAPVDILEFIDVSLVVFSWITDDVVSHKFFLKGLKLNENGMVSIRSFDEDEKFTIHLQENLLMCLQARENRLEFRPQGCNNETTQWRFSKLGLLINDATNTYAIVTKNGFVRSESLHETIEPASETQLDNLWSVEGHLLEHKSSRCKLQVSASGETKCSPKLGSFLSFRSISKTSILINGNFLSNYGGMIGLYNLPTYNFPMGSPFHENGLLDLVAFTARAHTTADRNIHLLRHQHVNEILIDRPYSYHDHSINRCRNGKLQILPTTKELPNYPCYFDNRPKVLNLLSSSDSDIKFQEFRFVLNQVVITLANFGPIRLLHLNMGLLLFGYSANNVFVAKDFTETPFSFEEEEIKIKLQQPWDNIYFLIFPGKMSDFAYFNFSWDILQKVSIDLVSFTKRDYVSRFPGDSAVISYENLDEARFLRNDKAICQPWFVDTSFGRLGLHSGLWDKPAKLSINEIDINHLVIEFKKQGMDTFSPFYSLAILDYRKKLVGWFNIDVSSNLDSFVQLNLSSAFNLANYDKVTFAKHPSEIFNSACQALILLPYQYSYYHTCGHILDEYEEMIVFGDYCHGNSLTYFPKVIYIHTSMKNIQRNKLAISRCPKVECPVAFQMTAPSLGSENFCIKSEKCPKDQQLTDNSVDDTINRVTLDQYTKNLVVNEVGGYISYNGYPSFVELAGYPKLDLHFLMLTVACSNNGLDFIESSSLSDETLNSNGLFLINLRDWKHKTYNCSCVGIALIYNAQGVMFYEVDDFHNAEIIDGLVYETGYEWEVDRQKCQKLIYLITPGSVPTTTVSSNQLFKKFEKNNLQGVTLSLSRCSMFHPTRNNGAFSTTYSSPESENLCPSFKFSAEKMMLKVFTADYCSKSWQENESILRAAREEIEVMTFNTCAQNSTLMTLQNIQEMEIDCDSESFTFTLIGSSASEISNLQSCYAESVKGTKEISLKGRTFSIDNHCYRNCYSLEPQTIFFNHEELLLMIVGILLGSILILSISSVLLWFIRRKKRLARLGYKIQRNDISVTSFQAIVATTSHLSDQQVFTIEQPKMPSTQSQTTDQLND